MSIDQHPNTPQDFLIRLEIVPQDEQQTDVTDIDEVSREIVDSLRGSGYTVEPAYQATKGVPGFDIVIHHEALLSAILATVSSILQIIMKVRDRHAGKEKAGQKPFEVTLEINGKPLTIKASDVDSTTRLIEELQRMYPEITSEVLAQTSVKTKVYVPKKKRHPR